MKDGLSGTIDEMKYLKCSLLIGIVLLISACASQGPKRLPADRFNYNAAIGTSAREQMLLNIVRTRYQDMPVFLAVSSVVAQYAYEGNVGASYSREFINTPSPIPTSDTASVSANVAFSEFPTISYTPLAGEAFGKHLYSELSPELIFSGAQSGFSVDIIMQIGVQRIGIAENMSFSEDPLQTQSASDHKKLRSFFRAIKLFSILNDAEIIEVHRIVADKESGSINKLFFVITDTISEPMRPILEEFRQLVGLTNANQFLITERTTDLADDEISIQTRNVMAMIKFMSRGVEIPAEHIEQGWAIDYGLHHRSAELPENLFPFKMSSSEDHPGNVFAAVRYQDHWFYVEHGDFLSKRALEHLMIIFQLKAPVSRSSAPLLTLPTR
jgi:hypothetical protein